MIIKILKKSPFKCLDLWWVLRMPVPYPWMLQFTRVSGIWVPGSWQPPVSSPRVYWFSAWELSFPRGRWLHSHPGASRKWGGRSALLCGGVVLMVVWMVEWGGLVDKCPWLPALQGAVLYVGSYHLQSEVILLLPFQLRCLLFPFLAWWLWPGLRYRLNSRGESSHLHLVLDLRKKAFSLSPLSVMRAEGFS